MVLEALVVVSLTMHTAQVEQVDPPGAVMCEAGMHPGGGYVIHWNVHSVCIPAEEVACFLVYAPATIPDAGCRSGWGDHFKIQVASTVWNHCPFRNAISHARKVKLL